MIYENTETVIPFSVTILKNNGTPESGLTPQLYLYNDTTGVQLLNGAIMVEIGSTGHYRYLWGHTIQTNVTLSYTILNAGTLVGSGSLRVITTKKDLTDIIDLADGRAI